MHVLDFYFNGCEDVDIFYIYIYLRDEMQDDQLECYRKTLDSEGRLFIFVTDIYD
uniref:Uncharacterized protein n=1 Tax=Manihot esculenta TaxID=3983 RepID=A0A2C9UD56_MANES